MIRMRRKAFAATALVVGLVLLFGAAALDIVMESHRQALIVGAVGAFLAILGTGYHMLLPRQRGHRRTDRSDD